MSRTAEELVQAFILAFSQGDARSLAPFLDEDVSARFEEAGGLDGRRKVVEFWRRLFHTYPEVDLRIGKLVKEGSLVIVELLYRLKTGPGVTTSVKTISVFEIRREQIVSWVDHADLTDVPLKERELWRRLGAARW